MRAIHRQAIIVAAALCASTGAGAQEWSIETIGQDLGAVDFTIDDAGTLHVIYTEIADPAAPEFLYATNTGAGWQFEPIPETPEPGLIAIAVDGALVPHIAFVDSNLTVVYGVRSGGTWAFQPLPSSDHPYHPSIALDASGEPHIAYLTYGERIRYANRPGGAWTDEEVDQSFLDISHSRVALVLDSSGTPHIGAWEYFDGAAFFTRGPTDWTHENFGEWGQQPWVILDDDDHAHFLYYCGGICYATNSGGSWAIESIEPDVSTENNDIALDSRGAPAVSYSLTIALRYEAPDIYYETRTWFAHRVGGQWRHEEIDLAYDYSGPYYSISRLDFDADDNPHVMYRDPASGELRHATRASLTAVDEIPVFAGGISVSPNPFNPGTEVSFELADSGPVRLEIYDLAGRLVRVLFDGRREAGSHAERWDGRDDGGRELPSGVYVLRLEADGRSTTRKVVMLR